MRIGILDARAAVPFLTLAVCHDEQVARLASGVTALGQHIDTGLRREMFGRPLEGRLIRNLLSRQDAELWDVRRDDLCEREDAYICELGGKEIKRWRRIIGGT